MRVILCSLTTAAATLFVLTRCGGKPEISVLVPFTPPNLTTPAPTNVLDVRSVISSGISATFNDQTGGVNDIALNPVSGLPAVIYYDKSAVVAAGTTVGALKYAYQNASGSWVIEVIDANHGTAACGSANSFCLGAPNAAGGSTAAILKLAFRSNGTPVAAYVFGASRNTAGTKQIRFAERTNGQWSIATAFSSSTAVAPGNASTATTVDPIKGLQLLLDGSNRPHLFFTMYTQTIGNSVHMYSFRDATGNWTSTTVAPAVAGGTITAIAQGVQQSGATLCGASGRPLWSTGVVAAAAGVTRPQLVSCSALDASGACTSFSTLTLTNGCGTSQSCFASTITTTTNGGQRSDLVIDAGSQRPLLGIYTVATPSTSLLTVAAPMTCEQAQPNGAGAWGVPTTVAAAASGANGFRLAATDATSNENFAAYLVGTTAIRINRATGPSGAWLATGTLVEATTVGAEGVALAFEALTQTLHLSYAQLPTAAANAAGNDLKVAFGFADEIVDGALAGTLAVDIVDNLTTAFPTLVTPMLDAVRSSTGQVGFAYFYQDLTAADSKLFYGFRGGTAEAPVFGVSPVVGFAEGTTAPQLIGSYPSLAFDGNDDPLIAFYDGRAASQDLLLARSSDRGASFSVTVVDAIGNVGQYPSVAVRDNAIAVAYYDVTNSGLKFARHLPGQGWRRFAVDGMLGTGSCGNAPADAGSFAVLRIDSTGHPVIAYQSQSELRLAFAAEPISSATFNWTCLTLDSAGSTRGAGIAFTLAPGDEPRLVHFDATAGMQRYVRCANSLGNCVASGPTAFVGQNLAPTGTLATVVTRPTLLVLADGREFAAFHSASFGALTLASRPSPAAAWNLEYLDAPPPGTSFSSVGGQYAVLLENDSLGPSVIYRSYENWLRYFSRETR